MARKPVSRVKSAIQAFIYWLGPLYCVLLGSLLLFASFIIQLLTSIGVPYIKSFDFFRFDFDDLQFVELGMWAACSGKPAEYIPTQNMRILDEQFNCPPAMWGWDTTQFSGITQNFFHHTLPKALIFHPISCCFTFFALVTALVTMKRKRHHWTLPLFSFCSCFFALISFIIDVATFVPAKHKLEAPGAEAILGHRVISTQLGPAFWLSLATFCSDMIGNFIIISGYGIWRYQRISREQRRRNNGYTQDIEVKAGSRMSKRSYFANESDDELGPSARGNDSSFEAGHNSFLMSSFGPSKLSKRNLRRKPVAKDDDSFTATSKGSSTSRARPQTSRAVIGASAVAAMGGAGLAASRTSHRRGLSTRASDDDEDDGDEMRSYASSENVLDERSREAEAFDLPQTDDEEDEEEEEEEEEQLVSEDEDDEEEEADEGETDDVFSDGDAYSTYADARSEAGRSTVDVSEPGRSSSPFAHERRAGVSSRRKPVEAYYDDD